jgi:phage baseplate assembly protein W
MQITYPFQFDRQGRTATTDHAAHVRQMMEQVLFTNPGERLNRPDFGSGLLQLVHAPNSDVAAAALEANVHGALQRWLGDVISLEQLHVENEENKLTISVTYSLPQAAERRTEVFERSRLA